MAHLTHPPAKPKPAAKAAPATTPWWKSGIIYQLYIRSFYDTNGDGVGDLPGVIAKLDYLEGLGIDGIWLSPITSSANADWGYDVTDYYSVDPDLGTLDDFDQLVAEAKKRNIQILIDFVPNHTSVKHPWFLNALTGSSAQYRDFYIWGNPKKDGRPPSNWRAYGGGSAWSYHKPTGQYYLHNFFKEQADLNWRNPAVREEFDKIMRFWLDRGIAGFRIDIFNMLIKDAQFRDNPKATKTDEFEIRRLGQRPVHTVSQPEIHGILRHWRKITDSYAGALLLGETTHVYSLREIARFYGAQDELELAFNLKFLWSPFTAPALKQVVEDTETAIAAPNWPLWTGSNHDERRFPTRWADNDERKIRCGLLMVLSLRGTPILYYGDELGMSEVFVPPWRMKDPRGRRNWPVDGGRDRYRTPMPWKNQLGAGFTLEHVRPWLPYGDMRLRNVAREIAGKDSTLQFTRDLIALRRGEPDLHLGAYTTVESIPTIWSWQRGDGFLVAINFSDYHQEIRHIQGSVEISTLRSHDKAAVDGLLHLDPWEGVVVRLA